LSTIGSPDDATGAELSEWPEIEVFQDGSRAPGSESGTQDLTPGRSAEMQNLLAALQASGCQPDRRRRDGL
jgi:hypothetical protein